MSMENILLWGVMNVKKNFGVEMKNKKKLKKLKKELKEMEESNMAAWHIYGSELSTGGMIAEENELKEKIKKLEEKLK